MDKQSLVKDVRHRLTHAPVKTRGYEFSGNSYMEIDVSDRLELTEMQIKDLNQRIKSSRNEV